MKQQHLRNEPSSICFSISALMVFRIFDWNILEEHVQSPMNVLLSDPLISGSEQSWDDT